MCQKDATPEKMSKTNLYVRGLPNHFDEAALRELVPHPSKVKSVKIAKDEYHMCKGYGFIDFLNKDSAEEAKQYLELNYSIYPVKYAKENEKDRTNLYISNLPKQWNSADSDKLKVIFEQYGYVQSAFIMLEKNTNKPTGVGFVRYSREEDAERALTSLKRVQLVLPGCQHAVEAKLADKHSPDTRKRRNVETALELAATPLIGGFPDKFQQLSAPSEIVSSSFWPQTKSSSPFFLSGSNCFVSPNPNVVSPILSLGQLPPGSLYGLLGGAAGKNPPQFPQSHSMCQENLLHQPGMINPSPRYMLDSLPLADQPGNVPIFLQNNSYISSLMQSLGQPKCL